MRRLLQLFFRESYPFQFGFACVAISLGLFLFRASYGVFASCDELIIVRGFGECGAVSRNGTLAIPFQYSKFGEFNRFGLSVVRDRDNGLWGCINRQGRTIIPLKWAKIRDSGASGAMWAMNETQTCLFNRHGALMENYSFSFEPPFCSVGVAAAQRGQAWFLVDRKGQICSKRYDRISQIGSRNLFKSTQFLDSSMEKEIVEIIDPSGKTLPNGVFDYLLVGSNGSYFDPNGQMLVRRNGLWGWVDTECHETIPCVWDRALPFTYFSDDGQALAAVKSGDSWGFINPDGKLAIPLLYRWARPFSENGLAACAAESGERGWIDRRGLFRILSTDQRIRDFSTLGLACFENGRMVGCIDSVGHQVLPCSFTGICLFNGFLDRPWVNNVVHAFGANGWSVYESNGALKFHLGERPGDGNDGMLNEDCVSDGEFGIYGANRYRPFLDGRWANFSQPGFPVVVNRTIRELMEPLTRERTKYRVFSHTGQLIWSSDREWYSNCARWLFAIVGTFCMVVRPFVWVVGAVGRGAQRVGRLWCHPS